MAAAWWGQPPSVVGRTPSVLAKTPFDTGQRPFGRGWLPCDPAVTVEVKTSAPS